MGFTCLPYFLATGGAVTDADMSAVTDQEFSQRNSHFIFTEPYSLRAHVAMGATGTRYNVQVPTWNAVGRFNVWPIMLSSANILSPPRVAWMEGGWPLIPMNEEYTVKATDGASENTAYLMFPFTPGHTANIPANKLIIPVRATASVTQVANGWSAPAALTMEQSLRGGIYSIIGAECVIAASAAFRLIFPRSRYYMGRRLRPGWLCQQAIGDLPEPRLQINPLWFGEWGRFHTFEQPTVEAYGLAATSTVTAELRLWLAFIGEAAENDMNQWVAAGWQ